MTSKGLVAILASVAVALVIALPASAGSSATVVNVTAGKPSELKFTLSKKLVTKGKVTPKLKPGKSVTLTVVLKKGKAPYLCTLPGHAAAGMKGVITVK